MFPGFAVAYLQPAGLTDSTEQPLLQQVDPGQSMAGRVRGGLNFAATALDATQSPAVQQARAHYVWTSIIGGQSQAARALIFGLRPSVGQPHQSRGDAHDPNASNVAVPTSQSPIVGFIG